jgi:hypothetical protein
MPQRRRVQKSSFASHFNELVSKFTAEEKRTERPARRNAGRKKRPVPCGNINERLFEDALR